MLCVGGMCCERWVMRKRNRTASDTGKISHTVDSTMNTHKEAELQSGGATHLEGK